MAKTILTNCSITVNGVDLSDHASKVTIDDKKDQIDVTSFGASNKEYALGLGDATIAVDLFQDFASASVDSTLYSIFQGGTAVPVVVWPSGTVTSGTNPSYTMQGLLPEYTPLDGQVGQASQLSVTFINGDQTGVVRATA